MCVLPCVMFASISSYSGPSCFHAFPRSSLFAPCRIAIRTDRVASSRGRCRRHFRSSPVSVHSTRVISPAECALTSNSWLKLFVMNTYVTGGVVGCARIGQARTWTGTRHRRERPGGDGCRSVTPGYCSAGRQGLSPAAFAVNRRQRLVLGVGGTGWGGYQGDQEEGYAAED